jgi:hypothetical protein
MSLPYWINKGWHGLCRREGMNFQRATRSVRDVQKSLLLNTIQQNVKSDYGQRFRFDSIQSIDDYRCQVPVASYESLREDMDRIYRGDKRVLTEEPIERLVPTGGSSGGAKLIPYTRSLKRDFQKAIAAWIWWTFQFYPQAMQGRAYWSITPMVSSRQKSAGGLPLGFESDSEYLGKWSRWFAQQLILPPACVGRIGSIENARYANLLYLLECSRLSLISIWSPTFLLSLVSQVDPWIESICRDISRGEVSLPRREPAQSHMRLKLAGNPQRADELKRLYREYGNSPDFVRRCWPELGLISCWGDGNSAAYFASLQKLFPHAESQPKGLLATECVVSFPGCENGDSVLAIRSHFFEFAPVLSSGETDYGNLRLADELVRGDRYRILVTTNGGLYRYDLGDIIEVVGFLERCPRVRFVGRIDAVCDLVGEKLHEEHVRVLLESLMSEFGVDAEFFMLVARQRPNLGYTLILSADSNLRPVDQGPFARSLEERLRTNPQYTLARNLNQLSSVDVRILSLSGKELWSRYEKWQSGLGKRVGELKVNVLDYRGTWHEFLSQLDGL